MLAPRCTISSLGNDFLSGVINPVRYVKLSEWPEKRYHEALENPLVLEKIMGYVDYEDRPGCFFFARTLMYLGYELLLDVNYVNHAFAKLIKRKKSSNKLDYQKVKDILMGRTVGYYCTRCFVKIKCNSPIDCISYRPLCDDCFEKVYPDSISEFEARTMLAMLGFDSDAQEIACMAIEYTKIKKNDVIRRMKLRKRREMKEGVLKGMWLLPFRRMGKGAPNIFLRRHIVELDARYTGKRSSSNFIDIYRILSAIPENLDRGYIYMGAFEAHLLHNIIEENEWVIDAMRRRYGCNRIVWENGISTIKQALEDRVQQMADRKQIASAELMLLYEDDDAIERGFCSVCSGKCAKPMIKQEHATTSCSQNYFLDFCYGCEVSKAELYNQVYGWEKKEVNRLNIKRKKEFRTRYLSQ